MSKGNGRVMVGVANEGETMFTLDDVATWEPKKVTVVGSSIFFEQGGTFLSMDRMKFKEIFGNDFYKFK